MIDLCNRIALRCDGAGATWAILLGSLNDCACQHITGAFPRSGGFSNEAEKGAPHSSPALLQARSSAAEGGGPGVRRRSRQAEPHLRDAHLRPSLSVLSKVSEFWLCGGHFRVKIGQ